MATFQNTVTIRRAIDDVFAFLADFENVPTWNYAIVETKKTSPGPMGVGTTYRQIRSIPDRSEEGLEVTAFEPTSRLEVHGNIGHFIATISYLLTPTGDGTRLTNVVNLKPSSGALRLLAPPGCLQGQGVGGSQPRHAQAGSGNWTADMTRDEGITYP